MCLKNDVCTFRVAWGCCIYGSHLQEAWAGVLGIWDLGVGDSPGSTTALLSPPLWIVWEFLIQLLNLRIYVQMYFDMIEI